MFDGTTTARMQRSQGEAVVGLARSGLTQLRQRGSAKAFLPRVDGVPEIVFLNTSGGLTSGDRLHLETRIGAGMRAVATTQTAERAYRADAGPARVTVRHAVGPGAWLDWLPQETILFDRADLDRDTGIDLAPDAGCLMLETLVLGRAAMGERLTRLRLADRRRITRAGRPLHLEPLMLDDRVLAGAARPAMLGGAQALATLVLCAQGAEDAVDAVRARLTLTGVDSAASGYDGRLVVRLLAADAWPLRRQVLTVLDVLRRGAAPPRVWQDPGDRP